MHSIAHAELFPWNYITLQIVRLVVAHVSNCVVADSTLIARFRWFTWHDMRTDSTIRVHWHVFSVVQCDVTFHTCWVAERAWTRAFSADEIKFWVALFFVAKTDFWNCIVCIWKFVDPHTTSTFLTIGVSTRARHLFTYWRFALLFGVWVHHGICHIIVITKFVQTALSFCSATSILTNWWWQNGESSIGYWLARTKIRIVGRVTLGSVHTFNCIRDVWMSLNVVPTLCTVLTNFTVVIFEASSIKSNVHGDQLCCYINLDSLATHCRWRHQTRQHWTAGVSPRMLCVRMPLCIKAWFVRRWSAIPILVLQSDVQKVQIWHLANTKARIFTTWIALGCGLGAVLELSPICGVAEWDPIWTRFTLDYVAITTRFCIAKFRAAVFIWNICKIYQWLFLTKVFSKNVETPWDLQLFSHSFSSYCGNDTRQGCWINIWTKSSIQNIRHRIFKCLGIWSSSVDVISRLDTCKTSRSMLTFWEATARCSSNCQVGIVRCCCEHWQRLFQHCLGVQDDNVHITCSNFGMRGTNACWHLERHLFMSSVCCFLLFIATVGTFLW